MTGLYFVVKLIMLQVYPAYSCFKTIKAKDQSQYLPALIYWVTATLFITVEPFADIVLFWLPFYNELKLIMVLWITLPQTKGALVLYADAIEPFLTRHEKQIDKMISDAQDRTKETVVAYGKQLIQIMGKLITEALNKGQAIISDGSMVGAAATAAAPPEQPPASVPAGQPNSSVSWGNWYPYLAVSSLISRGSLLAERLQGDTRSTEGEPSTSSTSVEEPNLEKTDSYDSLASFVKPGASPTTSSASATATTSSATSATWGAYISGWVWPAKSQAPVDKTE